MLDYGIGLTDLNQREAGPDATLSASADDEKALTGKIARYRPAILAFNGKRPARAFLGLRKKDALNYGVQQRRIGATAIHALPPTSGAAARWWDERFWQALAAAVRGLA